MNTYTIPNSFALRIFKENDFSLDSKDKVCIFDDDCYMILFYGEDEESISYLDSFTKAAEHSPGPMFGTCNVDLETEVEKSIVEIMNENDHPFKWISTGEIPFIVVYRNGYPIWFYEGPNDMESMVTFSIDYACNPEYNMFNRELIDKINTELEYSYDLRNPTILDDSKYRTVQVLKSEDPEEEKIPTPSIYKFSGIKNRRNVL